MTTLEPISTFILLYLLEPQILTLSIVVYNHLQTETEHLAYTSKLRHITDSQPTCTHVGKLVKF